MLMTSRSSPIWSTANSFAYKNDRNWMEWIWCICLDGCRRLWQRRSGHGHPTNSGGPQNLMIVMKMKWSPFFTWQMGAMRPQPTNSFCGFSLARKSHNSLIMNMNIKRRGDKTTKKVAEKGLDAVNLVQLDFEDTGGNLSSIISPQNLPKGWSKFQSKNAVFCNFEENGNRMKGKAKEKKEVKKIVPKLTFTEEIEANKNGGANRVEINSLKSVLAAL
jgi:hypothetical protein